MKKLLTFLLVLIMIALKFSNSGFSQRIPFSTLIPILFMTSILLNKYRVKIKNSTYIFENFGIILYLLTLFSSIIHPQLVSYHFKIGMLSIVILNMVLIFIYYYKKTNDWKIGLRKSLSEKTANITIKEWSLLGATYRLIKGKFCVEKASVDKLRRIKIISVIFSSILLVVHYILFINQKHLAAHFLILFAHFYLYQWILGIIQLNEEANVEKYDGFYEVNTLFQKIKILDTMIKKTEPISMSNEKKENELKLNILGNSKYRLYLKEQIEVEGFGNSRMIDSISY